MYGVFDGGAERNDFQAVKAVGLNTTQQYCSKCTPAEKRSFADAAGAAGLQALAYLNVGGDAASSTCTLNVAACKTFIDQLTTDLNFVIWGLPEEADLNDAAQTRMVSALSSYIHTHDPFRRPVFEYTVSGLPARFMQAYVPYLDIIGEGAYEIYDGLGAGDAPNCRGTVPYPNAWVRWLAEQEISAITNTGHTTAANDRTPILIEEAFCTTCKGIGTVCPSAPSIVHDSFTALSAGLKGILFYDWPSLQGMTNGQLQAVNTAASLIAGQEAIGEWVLKGIHEDDLPVAITSGPRTTPSFSPTRHSVVSYPSLRAATFDRAGVRLIIAVNSSPSAVSAIISGLPAGVPAATVVNEARTVAITHGTLSDSFTALGVHLYKVSLVSRQHDGTWIALD